MILNYQNKEHCKLDPMIKQGKLYLAKKPM